MKIKEIRELNIEELSKRIKEEEENLIDLKFTHELKQLTNTSKLKLSRKTIARLKTVLQERKLLDKKSKQEVKKKGAAV